MAVTWIVILSLGKPAHLTHCILPFAFLHFAFYILPFLYIVPVHFDMYTHTHLLYFAFFIFAFLRKLYRRYPSAGNCTNITRTRNMATGARRHMNWHCVSADQYTRKRGVLNQKPSSAVLSLYSLSHTVAGGSNASDHVNAINKRKYMDLVGCGEETFTCIPRVVVSLSII